MLLIGIFALLVDQDSSTLLGMELTWFVLVAVSSILVVCAFIVGIAICICRRSTRGAGAGNGNAMQCTCFIT